MIALIYAASLNNVIGKDGTLPWHVPSDLKHFKAVTLGKPVIMGRKTWNSLPRKPLPARKNIVMTRDQNFKPEGAEVAQSTDAALALASNASEVCVIGGAEIFHAFMPIARRIYLSRILFEVVGDVRMPPLDTRIWKQVSRSAHQKAENDDAAFETLIFDRY